jgi:hypothetical protein
VLHTLCLSSQAEKVLTVCYILKMATNRARTVALYQFIVTFDMRRWTNSVNCIITIVRSHNILLPFGSARLTYSVLHIFHPCYSYSQYTHQQEHNTIHIDNQNPHTRSDPGSCLCTLRTEYLNCSLLCHFTTTILQSLYLSVFI